jgi:hypothetical protein
MRLGAIGWFGYCNAGDDRIAEVLMRRLQGFHVSLLPSLPPPPEVANWFDGILLTGGIWHPRNRLALDFHLWSKDVRVPILALGLGVESMPRELRKGSAALVRRCEMVWVRDQESRRLLGDAPNVIAGPDVTWAEPYVVGSDWRVTALNLRPWPRADWSPDDWVQAARGLVANERELSAWPLAPDDAELLRGYLGDVPDTFELDILRQAGRVISMRLHGLIFAAQQGVPAIGIGYDPKCERFLREIGRPEWLLPLKGSGRLAETAADVQSKEEEELERLRHLGPELTRRARELLVQAAEVLRASGPRSQDLPARGATWLARQLLRTAYRNRR